MLNFDKQAFKDVLKNIGIKKGDNLFIHSTLAALGKSQNPAEIFEAIWEVLDYNGTLVFPTYSFSSWTQNKIFNSEETITDTGILANLFFRKNEVYRTIQGNHSIAIWGELKDKVAKDWVTTSFSKNSAIFQTVIYDFKNLIIGTPLASGCSIFHCVEEIEQVPYRFFKSFLGNVEHKGVRKEFDFKMYVRDLSYKVDLNKAETTVASLKSYHSQKYNYGTMTSFSLQEAYEAIERKIKRQPFFLAEKT